MHTKYEVFCLAVMTWIKVVPKIDRLAKNWMSQVLDSNCIGFDVSHMVYIYFQVSISSDISDICSMMAQ